MPIELKEGVSAPDFLLASSTGGEISLRGLRGRPVVLYFYPKDDTPGCTREACAFRDPEAELQSAGRRGAGGQQGQPAAATSASSTSTS